MGDIVDKQIEVYGKIAYTARHGVIMNVSDLSTNKVNGSLNLSIIIFTMKNQDFGKPKTLTVKKD